MSRKGAKSRTHGRKLRSTGTKARTRVGRIASPRRKSSRRTLASWKRSSRRTRARGRACRGAGAADRDLGGAAGHLQFARRLEPVFEAMLANATRICGASSAFLLRYDGEPSERLRITGPPALRSWAEPMRPAARSASRSCAIGGSKRPCRSPTSQRPQSYGYPAIRASRVSNRRRTHRLVVADAQGDVLVGAICHLPPGGPAVHRQADRAGHRTSPTRP